jgi:Zn-dependent protease
MRWSWRVGRPFGIAVSVHATFLIFLVWIGASAYLRQGRVEDAVAGLAVILAVFASVVAHELGHALVARRFGIATRDITLLPIGGVARLERMPDKPAQELAIAVAGPIVSLALAGGFALAGQMAGPGASADPVTPAFSVNELARINLMLGLFNLLPAFPMDGGRILRALLAWRGDRLRATRIAAGIGQGLAMLLAAVGLFANPVLIFIALFVWIGAASEAGAAQAESLLVGVPVRAAMLTEFRALGPDDTLGLGAQLLLSGSQADFPVVAANGTVVGVLTRDVMVRGLAADGPTGRVAAWMTTQFHQTRSTTPLIELAERIQRSGCPVVPVVDDAGLSGIVTIENIGEFLLLQGAVPAWRKRWATAPIG